MPVNSMGYRYKEFTERHRPHFHPPGATLFVTFRLADSIPQSVLRGYEAQKDWLNSEEIRLRALRLTADSPELTAHEERLRQFNRNWFGKFEDALHKEKCGPTWLKNEAVAGIIAEALHWRDGKVYRLDAFCIMSNHVHAVFAPYLTETDLRAIQTDEGLTYESTEPPLDVIMHSLKSWTAGRANAALGREGQFWQHESYDHVVRDAGEFDRIVTYVMNNPVKAGLVKNWKEWRWSWRRE
jgi:REP element-mobilizing transposase RayT